MLIYDAHAQEQEEAEKNAKRKTCCWEDIKLAALTSDRKRFDSERAIRRQLYNNTPKCYTSKRLQSIVFCIYIARRFWSQYCLQAGQAHKDGFFLHVCIVWLQTAGWDGTL
jgi:hypothetical protein